MLVVLRDGRKLFGVLRSYDQFGTHDYIHVPHPLFFLCSREDVNVFFFLFFCLFLFGGCVLTHSPRFIANLVLEDTVERIYHQDVFAEQWVGLFLIRGENVVLLGEIVSVKKSLPLRFMLHIYVAGAVFSQFLITLPRLSGS